MEEMTTPEQRLAELERAATPAPWRLAEEIDGVHTGRSTVIMASAGDGERERRVVSVCQVRDHHVVRAEANVALIVAIRNELPALLRWEKRYADMLYQRDQALECVREAQEAAGTNWDAATAMHRSWAKSAQEADRLRLVVDAARTVVADILQMHPDIRDAHPAWFTPGVKELVTAMDALDAAEAVCGVCRLGIGWIECPTGGWWAHDDHPADGHDAEPIRPAAHVERPTDRPQTLTCRYTGPVSPDDPECGAAAVVHLRKPDFSAGALACLDHAHIARAAGLTVEHEAKAPCATRQPMWISGPPSHCVPDAATVTVALDSPDFVPEVVSGLMLGAARVECKLPPGDRKWCASSVGRECVCVPGGPDAEVPE